MVYFDNASTTLKPLPVVKAMDRYYLEYPVNAGRGEYDLAHLLETEIEISRKKSQTLSKQMQMKLYSPLAQPWGSISLPKVTPCII